MKKLLLALAIATLTFTATTDVSAAERMLPDTNLISSKTKLVVVGNGKNVRSVYVSQNPTMYNRQKIAAGVIEGSYDSKTNSINVMLNGNTVKE